MLPNQWQPVSFRVGFPPVRVLALALGMAVAACRPPASPGPAGAVGPVPVTVAPAVEQPLMEYETLTARLEAVESVEIRPRVSGYLAEIRFQPGQLVRRGEVLFVIDRRPFQAALARAEAELERARVLAEWAARDEKRSAELLSGKAISGEEADQRQTRRAEARASLAAAEAAVAVARLNVEYAEIRSPINGRISRALVTVGNNVSGVDGFTTLLSTVVSVDPIHAYADLPESSFLRLQHLPGAQSGGLPAALGLADEQDFPRSGRVESLDNRLDAGTGTLVLRAVFPNPDGHLVPGLFGRLRIPVSGEAPVVLVGERAIGTDQSQKFVYTLTASNTVAYRPVKLGPLVGGSRVIREGLRAGEVVIVNGLQRVQPGMPVLPQAGTNAPAAAPAPGP